MGIRGGKRLALGLGKTHIVSREQKNEGDIDVSLTDPKPLAV